jgi:hypothetical protein
VINTRTGVIVALGLVFSTYALQGQDQSRYRDFQLGRDLATVSALARISASDAKTIHLRPAVIQELEWRPGYVDRGSITTQTDTVRQIVFRFYNDQLSKMVVDYDYERTAGMTDVDMIEAISTAYGPPSKTPVKNAGLVMSRVEADSGTPVARWGDADYSVVLYRGSYRSALRLIVTSPRLEALTRTAAVQATLLDEREAPQREIARLKKEAEDARVAQEKVRTVNKAAFRP